MVARCSSVFVAAGERAAIGEQHGSADLLGQRGAGQRVGEVVGASQDGGGREPGRELVAADLNRGLDSRRTGETGDTKPADGEAPGPARGAPVAAGDVELRDVIAGRQRRRRAGEDAAVCGIGAFALGRHLDAVDGELPRGYCDVGKYLRADLNRTPTHDLAEQRVQVADARWS